MCISSTRHRGDQGQATIAMVAVIAIAIALVMTLSVFAEAIVHRARARNAADAIALATAADVDAADALTTWYVDRDVIVERTGNQTIARSGPSQAAAWASTQASAGQPAPALIAIVARAEQLLNITFATVQWQSTVITLAAGEASNLRLVAGDLGLCEQLSGPANTGSVRFELC